MSRWPWSSTPSAASSSAGRPPGRCAPTWRWTRWSWPAGAGRPSWRAGASLGQGSQYLAIRSTERLAEAGAVTSVGSRGDSYDNALAETIIGLSKTELIGRRGPWKRLDQVESATLEWVDWFHHRRLPEPIGHVPPAEFQAAYHRREDPAAPPDSRTQASSEPGAVHIGAWCWLPKERDDGERRSVESEAYLARSRLFRHASERLTSPLTVVARQEHGTAVR